MSLVTKGLKSLVKGGEKKAARKGAEELAVRKAPVKPKAPVKSDLTVPRKAPVPKPKPKPKALPAPEKRLALPAPGPGLPDYAAKPRGGQWFAPEGLTYGMFNPAQAVKNSVYLGERFSSAPRDKALAEWLDRALPRYIQNDFATPDDPLRALADRGYIPTVENAEQWSGIAKQDIIPLPLQKLLFDPKMAEVKAKDEVLAAMPWVNKLPATETLYGVFPRDRTKEVYGHVLDEMRNALRAEEVGLPADLAVRPESLARMSFPQAVERVGRINQWRAKEADRAALSALDSPAIQVFKEYPENNPGGLRWVELRAPQFTPETLPEGYSLHERPNNNGGTYYSLRDDRDGGREIGFAQSPSDAIRMAQSRIEDDSLQQALKYEGDVMGHCVGGYCDDVASGRSRIFSLRDARGEPHVTIETAPKRGISDTEYLKFYQQAAEQLGKPIPRGWNDMPEEGYHELNMLAQRLARESSEAAPENIVQIKGKQNQAPKADYLPYVQDFVKSGQWGEIGDFANTGLVRLPDQRLIRQEDWNTGIRRAVAERNPQWSPERLDEIIRNSYSRPGGRVEDRWADEYAPYFEGFAVGGRVRNNLAVRGR